MLRYFIPLALIIVFIMPIYADSADTQEPSIDDLKETIRQNPGDMVARRKLAVSYYEKGDLKLAIIQLESLIQLDPRDIDMAKSLVAAYGMISMKLQAQKEYPESLRYADKAIALARRYQQDTVPGQYQRVIVLSEQGEMDQALEELSQLPPDVELTTDAQDLVVAALLRQAKASIEQKDYQKAMEQIAKAFQVSPEKYSYLHLQTVHILAYIGETEKAIEVLGPLARVLPQNDDLFQYRIGSLYKKLGETSTAIDFLTRVPEDSPYYEPAQSLLEAINNVTRVRQEMQEAIAAGDLDTVVVKLRELVKLDPSQDRMRLSLAKLLIQQEEKQEALAELEILSLSPRIAADPFYQLGMGKLYNALEQQERSARLLKLIPEDSSHYSEAQELLKSIALPIEPDVKPDIKPDVKPDIEPDVNINIKQDQPLAPSLRTAQTLFDQGHGDEAVLELDRLVSDTAIQRDDRMEYEIGILYMQLGDKSNAEEHLKAVSVDSPFHRAAQTFLTEPVVDEPVIEISIAAADKEPQSMGPLHPVEKRIRDIINKYKIEMSLALALMRQESSFRIHAVSKGVGAAGLCQIMPATGRDLGLKIPRYKDSKKPKIDPKADERFDPYKCMDAGFKYLRQLLNRYDGNVPLALSAYNAGMGRTKSRVARIYETTAYVSDIMTFYYRYQEKAVLDQAMAKLVANVQAE